MNMSKQEYLQNWAELEQHASSSILTDPSDGRVYDYKKLLSLVKELGRPLTEDEAMQYRIK